MKRQSIQFFLTLLLVGFSTAVMACSITASGRCGGSACDDGYSCKKTSDFECGCVANHRVDISDVISDGEVEASSTVSGTLKKGESFVVYAGSVAQTFNISLLGTIQPGALIDISVDGAVAVTLNEVNRRTIVNGQKIILSSRGPKPQGFVARLND